MDLPFMRNDEQQASAGLQRSLDLAQGAAGLTDVFQSYNVYAGVERSLTKGERGEVGDGIQLSVIPSRVADGEVNGEIMLAQEIFRVDSFAGAGVKHTCFGRKRGGEA